MNNSPSRRTLIKRLVGVGLAVFVLAAALFANTFRKSPLSVPSAQVTPLPAAPKVEGVSLSQVSTGYIETQAGLSVRGGGLNTPLTSAMVAFVVHHPAGDLLIDAGIAKRGLEHFETTPFLMQALVDLNMKQGIAEGLIAGGIDPASLRGVLLTHAHWDHVSGLEDLPGVTVWLTEVEQHFAEKNEHGLLYRQILAEHPFEVSTLVFDDGAYGPFSSSWDVYGDGSVVAVPMAGHTPGSVGVVVNLPSGERFLFIGDTAWAREGVLWPAEKPWISRRSVDTDAAQVREQLRNLHQLQATDPALTVVPAHDARTHTQIPMLMR